MWWAYSAGYQTSYCCKVMALRCNLEGYMSWASHCDVSPCSGECWLLKIGTIGSIDLCLYALLVWLSTILMAITGFIPQTWGIQSHQWIWCGMFGGDMRKVIFLLCFYGKKGGIWTSSFLIQCNGYWEGDLWWCQVGKCRKECQNLREECTSQLTQPILDS